MQLGSSRQPRGCAGAARLARCSVAQAHPQHPRVWCAVAAAACGCARGVRVCVCGWCVCSVWCCCTCCASPAGSRVSAPPINCGRARAQSRGEEGGRRGHRGQGRPPLRSCRPPVRRASRRATCLRRIRGASAVGSRGAARASLPVVVVLGSSRSRSLPCRGGASPGIDTSHRCCQQGPPSAGGGTHYANRLLAQPPAAAGQIFRERSRNKQTRQDSDKNATRGSFWVYTCQTVISRPAHAPKGGVATPPRARDCRARKGGCQATAARDDIHSSTKGRAIGLARSGTSPPAD